MTPLEFERQSQLRVLLQSTKRRAKLKGLEFSLDFDWLKRSHDDQSGRCILTGIEFTTMRDWRHKRNPFAPSIDRIGSDLGYTKVNCRLVCCAVNLALGEWGEHVFAAMARGYLRNRYSM